MSQQHIDVATASSANVIVAVGGGKALDINRLSHVAAGSDDSKPLLYLWAVVYGVGVIR